MRGSTSFTGTRKSVGGRLMIGAMVALLAVGVISSTPASAEGPAAEPAVVARDVSGAPPAAVTAAATAPDPGTAAPRASDAQIPAASAPKSDPANHDLTPLGMFLAADPIVKGVMILLALASVVAWTILLVKSVGLALAKRRMRASLAALRSASSLDAAVKKIRRGVCAQLLVEAEEELGLSRGLPSEGIKERVAIALGRVETRAAKRMAVGTGILATIGSIGPFVGLFGTVWGIMRSFIGIANTNTTNLAIVAPGIAEALLATGIGLVAAIPAVVIYNTLTRSIGGYRLLMGDAVALIVRHLSRDLDRRALGPQGAQTHLRVAAE